MHRRLLLSRVIHGDDTGGEVARAGGGPDAARRTCGCTSATPTTPTWCSTSRPITRRTGPERFLKGYKGYLQADALAQYEGLYGDGPGQARLLLGARPPQVRGGGRRRGRAGRGGAGADPPAVRHRAGAAAAAAALGRPGGSSSSVGSGKSNAGRRGSEQAEPVLDELKKWLDEQTAEALPKSPLGQAIGYALNNWAALERYLEQGYLAIDNNLSERTLRAIALGRNYADLLVMRSRCVLLLRQVEVFLPVAG